MELVERWPRPTVADIVHEMRVGSVEELFDAHSTESSRTWEAAQHFFGEGVPEGGVYYDGGDDDDDGNDDPVHIRPIFEEGGREGGSNEDGEGMCLGFWEGWRWGRRCIGQDESLRMFAREQAVSNLAQFVHLNCIQLLIAGASHGLMHLNCIQDPY